MDREEHRRLFDPLSAGRWFGGLPRELRQLILSRTHLHEYGKGQIIAHAGGESPGLFVVIEGRVEVVKCARTCDESHGDVGEHGFWSGDDALIIDRPAEVGARAPQVEGIVAAPPARDRASRSARGRRAVARAQGAA